MAFVRLSTIRVRLIAGFGTSVGLLLVAGLLGWFGLQRSNAEAERTVRALADRSELTEQVTTSILREVVAGLRFLTSRSPDDESQYAALVAEAESFRRNALSVGMLRPDERRRLELIGTLKAAMEVRIAVTHAWQTIGNETNAQRVLQQTNREMQAIEAELQALRPAARSSADDSMDRMPD